jgi:hypothetical protein
MNHQVLKSLHPIAFIRKKRGEEDEPTVQLWREERQETKTYLCIFYTLHLSHLPPPNMCEHS